MRMYHRKTVSLNTLKAKNTRKKQEYMNISLFLWFLIYSPSENINVWVYHQSFVIWWVINSFLISSTTISIDRSLYKLWENSWITGASEFDYWHYQYPENLLTLLLDIINIRRIFINSIIYIYLWYYLCLDINILLIE